MSERSARAFNRSGAAAAAALIYPRLSKYISYLVRYLALFLPFSVIDSFGWFWIGNLRKNNQYMLEFLKGQFFVLHFSDLPDVICNTAIYADDTTVYSKCDQVSDLWQQLELASELESYLQDAVNWGRKRLVDFNAG